MNTKDEYINSILKGLDIPNDTHIISYVQRMERENKGQPVDMIKEIALNLKGNERYLAIFYTGLSFSPILAEMNDIETYDFMSYLEKALKLDEKRRFEISDYMIGTIRAQLRHHIADIDIIKGIINSKFTDVEKDYLIFVFGMVLPDSKKINERL